MRTKRKLFLRLCIQLILILGICGDLARGGRVAAQDKDMAGLKEQLGEVMKYVAGLSTALADYVTDNGYAPNQDGAYDDSGEFCLELVPFYIRQLVYKDPWGGSYLVYCGTACNGKYGIKDCKKDDFLIVCLGKDGKKDDWEYNYMNTQGGFFQLRSLDDFDKDLVNWNGSWIRSPLPDEMRR